MQPVVQVLLVDHDLGLVALAAAIAALASFAGVSLMCHARRSDTMARLVWTTIAGVSVGFGVWATHFVAMLAFDSGMSIGFSLGMTAASLAIAVLVTGTGLWFASAGRAKWDAPLGGAVVGIGISLMHYAGMTALVVGGQIVWDWRLVAVSVIMGMAFGAASLAVAAGGRKIKRRVASSVLLMIAIISMHFTAMGAASFARCYSIEFGHAVPPNIVALMIAPAAILILVGALGGLSLDLRDRQYRAREAERLRDLADAAVEGLVVCNGDRIATANRSFLDMVGMTEQEASGRSCADFIGSDAWQMLRNAPDQPIELELTAPSGVIHPVEAILHGVELSGGRQWAVAVRDVSVRKKDEQRIRYLAQHDHMTGLANRATFTASMSDAMAKARLAGSGLAVLSLDLDRFKQTNDTYGHAVGDAMLRRVGEILQRIVPSECTARLSGDEFAMLLGAPESEYPDRIASAILDALSHRNPDLPEAPPIAVSIGIAVYPRDAQTADDLLSCADNALDAAKQTNRGGFCLYEPGMGAVARDRHILEEDLRTAIDANQLSLVYQPQVDAQTGVATGFEALLRWHHPERGVVTPQDFIPIAEESGLIVDIGTWVLRAACREAATWDSGLCVAVNVSAIQIHDPDFVPTVAAIISEVGIAPHRLEIEVTETAILRDPEAASDTLRKIKALGIKIAMDDFGTGYSSLANLRAFPVDRIKLDRSFVTAVQDSPASATIVRAVLGLGRGLGVPVIAEGVETMKELQFLRDERCDAIQGYLAGEPKPIAAYRSVVEGAPITLVQPAGVPRRSLHLVG